MADRQGESEIVAVIVAAIQKHARGDVERLARRDHGLSCSAPVSRSANEGSRLRGSGMRGRRGARKVSGGFGISISC